MLGTILTIASGVGTGIGVGWLLWGQYTQPAGSISGIIYDKNWLLSRAYIGPINTGILWRLVLENEIGRLEHGEGVLRMFYPSWGELIIVPMTQDEFPVLMSIAREMLSRRI